MADWDWSRVVFDHVKLTVGDPEASKAFYRTVLAALEIPPLWEDERGGQYANLVVIGPGEPTAPIHIGFVARSPEEVDAFHAAALRLGGRDQGAPGLRPHYSASYYAAFVNDPDGHKLEAVHQ